MHTVAFHLAALVVVMVTIAPVLKIVLVRLVPPVFQNLLHRDIQVYAIYRVILMNIAMCMRVVLTNITDHLNACRLVTLAVVTVLCVLPVIAAKRTIFVVQAVIYYARIL